MQRLNNRLDDFVLIDLNPPPRVFNSPSLDDSETAETKIQRLISDHPVVIFTRSACCMCHVMKKLLATIGVHPAVIELDDNEIRALPRPDESAGACCCSSYESNGSSSPTSFSSVAITPLVFIGGTCVGGLESLVALHLSGHLIPKLMEVGALGAPSPYNL